MGFFSKLFSGIAPAPPTFEKLLESLAHQRGRVASAEGINRLRPGLVHAAVRDGQGVTYMDASGPGLVSFKLDAGDARLLASEGVAGIRSDVDRRTGELERELLARATVDLPSAVHTLLAIMAGSNINQSDLREACGYFLIEKLGSSATGEVLTALADEDENIRFQAAHVLRFLKSEQAVDALIVALQDPDGDVRAMVTQALGHQGDKKALPELRKAAEFDASTGVRKQAQAACEHLEKAT